MNQKHEFIRIRNMNISESQKHEFIRIRNMNESET